LKLRYIFKLRKKTKKKIRRFFKRILTKCFPFTIDRSRNWNDVPPYEQQWFFDGTYPCCLTCKNGQWMVGIGQGFRCTNENKIQLKDNPCKDKALNWWPIPHRQYKCRHYNRRKYDRME